MANLNQSDRSIATDETGELIASNKVDGTSVYGTDREKIGHIYNFMVDKRSGKVAYAVLVSGGLFGMGGEYYPLPWETLTYDTDLGGYVTNITKSRLDQAPHYSAGQEPTYDRTYSRQINDYYDVNAGL